MEIWRGGELSARRGLRWNDEVNVAGGRSLSWWGERLGERTLGDREYLAPELLDALGTNEV